MNLFELLFLLLVVVSLAVLLAVGIQTLHGSGARARRILARWGLGAAIYLVIVIGASAVGPERRTLRMGERRCFDDWCLTVVAVERFPSGAESSWNVALQLESRARRAPQGESGTVAYLIDARGRRFDPLPDAGEVAFDHRLQPGESIMTRRRFRLPADAHGVGFVYAHEGGFPIGWLIIGDVGWFRKPAVVALEEPPGARAPD